jgi:hypothetical protein
MKTIVFMDIDGVARPSILPNNYQINSECLKWINAALNHLDAQVVISSDWRLIYPISYFNNIFNGRVVGATSDLAHDYRGPHVRWHEIGSYRKKNDCASSPYLIFDDRSEYFPVDLDQLILCDSLTGFTVSEYKKTIEKHNSFIYPHGK